MSGIFTFPRKTVITRLVAVRKHADWCEQSREMNGVFHHLVNRFDGREILFLTMDFTNNTTRHQAILLASALGIVQVVEKFPNTGQILLLTFRGKQLFASLSPEQSFQEMVGKIARRLN